MTSNIGPSMHNLRKRRHVPEEIIRYQELMRLPETIPDEPMRLTETGREQILRGERKCSNIDAYTYIDPADTTKFQKMEIKMLVPVLVNLGLFLNYHV